MSVSPYHKAWYQRRDHREREQIKDDVPINYRVESKQMIHHLHNQGLSVADIAADSGLSTDRVAAIRANTATDVGKEEWEKIIGLAAMIKETVSPGLNNRPSTKERRQEARLRTIRQRTQGRTP